MVFGKTWILSLSKDIPHIVTWVNHVLNIYYGVYLIFWSQYDWLEVPCKKIEIFLYIFFSILEQGFSTLFHRGPNKVQNICLRAKWTPLSELFLYISMYSRCDQRAKLHWLAGQIWPAGHLPRTPDLEAILRTKYMYSIMGKLCTGWEKCLFSTWKLQRISQFLFVFSHRKSKFPSKHQPFLARNFPILSHFFPTMIMH